MRLNLSPWLTLVLFRATVNRSPAGVAGGIVRLFWSLILTLIRATRWEPSPAGVEGLSCVMCRFVASLAWEVVANNVDNFGIHGPCANRTMKPHIARCDTHRDEPQLIFIFAFDIHIHVCVFVYAFCVSAAL